MPRLSNDLYLQRHHFLRAGWCGGVKELFGVLPAHMQRDVHAYYQPSQELADDALIENRRSVAKTEPGLPQRASRAFLQMQDAFDEAYEAFEAADYNEAVFNDFLARDMPSFKSGSRTLRITAVARPELDLKRLARALVAQEQLTLGREERRGTVDRQN